MIYVFEDRSERKHQHQDIIDKYKSVISFAKFDIDDGMNLVDYINKNFLNAEIMIFHKSYSFKSNIVSIDAIKKEMPNVRFVVFSGGIENGTIDRDKHLVTINADVMYNNLEIFLKYLTNRKEINFEPLIWGEFYLQNRIVSLQNRLFREYFINADLDKRIEDNDKGSGIDDLLDMITLYCEDYGIDIYDELKEAIILEENSLTWGNLLRIIRKCITIHNN